MALDKKVAYIKSRIPRELWNESKGMAGLLGCTMTDFIIDALRNHVSMSKKIYEQRSGANPEKA